jgi:hypothetical protein
MLFMAKISKKVKPLVMLPLSALFFFSGVVMAQATTYYVATRGNNSNSGTAVDTPFLTIQKCADLMVAGDTCTVADGTYTVPDAKGIVVLIDKHAGTPSQPITLKSTNPLGAHVVLTSRPSSNHGIYVAQNYWIIEGFDVSGGANNSLQAVHSGFTLSGTVGTVIRRNTIHHIAWTVCSNAVYGNVGVFLDSASSATIVGNVFHNIGRLRNGESGCSTNINGNDHGIYSSTSPGLTVKRNIFHDVTRGWPIHVFKSGGGTTNNLNIYNNTFANQGPSGTNPRQGHIVLTGTVNNSNIKNNISYDGFLGMIHCPTGTYTNVVVDHNLSDKAINTMPCPVGVTFANNLTSTSPGFVSAGTDDYRLAAGSAAIDAGVAIAGVAYNGAAPDIGADEFPGQGGDSSPPLAPIGLVIH